VAPTFGDARDVCIEGPSGLLNALHLSRSYKGWNRSMGELFLPDGGVVFADGADDGALRIQGKNLAGLWADEVGLWRQWRTAWEESIAFAVRIDPALVVATGTPKRGHPLVMRLFNDETIPKTLLRTFDNAENLSQVALDELLRRYAGTTLGRQELEGEVLTDTPGALWRMDMILLGEAPLRFSNGDSEPTPEYRRIVVAIDPAVTYGPESDETGIIGGGVGIDGLGYVLDDQSGRFSPLDWARRAIALHDDLKADAIVAETNNGGDLVEANLRSVGFKGHFIKVTASRGKRVRAEPVAALYEQHRIKHRRAFVELEDQLCNFTPESVVSPDRLDALVWAFTELMLEPSYSGSQFSMIA
jgi:phage terminase large subunit-like protein